MGRTVATLGGILVLALLAGGLTETALAVGHQGSISNDVLLRPKQAHASVAVSTPSPKATPSPSPLPSASPVFVTTKPAEQTATTNAFVHMRASNSITSAILLSLNGDSQVQILPNSDPQWQQVEYGGVIGYIFKSYLDY